VRSGWGGCLFQFFGGAGGVVGEERQKRTAKLKTSTKPSFLTRKKEDLGWGCGGWL